jgi:phosphoglycerate dehydrogenase-like enzyme
MPHRLSAGKLHPSGLARLHTASGVTFDYVDEVSETSIQAHLPKADALVIRTQPLTAAPIASAPGLRIVSRHGVGYDAVESLHLPHADRAVLGSGELRLMKPGAIVDTARGGLVDDEVIASALREGRPGGAGIEVLTTEPPGVDHPLFGLDQAVLTPHKAALAVECAERMAVASVQKVLDFFAGKPDPTLIMNRNALA